MKLSKNSLRLKQAVKVVFVFSVALVLMNCANVSFITKDDLWKPAQEQIDEDLADFKVDDKGYKQKQERDGWKIVWQDEFNGTEVDSTKWNYEVNGDGGGNNELQYYTNSKNNVFVKNGYLVLRAKEQNYRGKAYTSGRLNSKKKGDWTYCRVDVRAVCPVQQGMWPAIWMLPTDYVYGGWPQSGEIDIMESIGHEPSSVYGTIHYGDPWPNNKNTGKVAKVKGELDDEFHVFSVEWEENEIRWFIDDSLYSTKTPKDTDPKKWPFDQRFHMILNVAVGGNWPGPPDETTQFPKYMAVDYVRVYKKTK